MNKSKLALILIILCFVSCILCGTAFSAWVYTDGVSLSQIIQTAVPTWNLNDTDFKNIIVNETQLNDTYSNITKEDFTQLIGKNIEEGIYRVEITGFKKKGEKSFIEKYKPINIQIRKIKDNENGFSMNYFVFFIFIITVTLLILLGVIRENKAIIIKQTRENYIELNDDEDEMINI